MAQRITYVSAPFVLSLLLSMIFINFHLCHSLMGFKAGSTFPMNQEITSLLCALFVLPVPLFYAFSHGLRGRNLPFSILRNHNTFMQVHSLCYINRHVGVNPTSPPMFAMCCALSFMYSISIQCTQTATLHVGS